MTIHPTKCQCFPPPPPNQRPKFYSSMPCYDRHLPIYGSTSCGRLFSLNQPRGHDVNIGLRTGKWLKLRPLVARGQSWQIRHVAGSHTHTHAQSHYHAGPGLGPIVGLIAEWGEGGGGRGIVHWQKNSALSGSPPCFVWIELNRLEDKLGHDKSKFQKIVN